MGLRFRILAKKFEDITWSADWQGKSFLKFFLQLIKFIKKYDVVETNYYRK
jgi:hypothetical protein